MKPFAELLALVDAFGDSTVAHALGCSVEYVRSWKPREHWQTHKIEPGIEPSMGFIACAICILRQ